MSREAAKVLFEKQAEGGGEYRLVLNDGVKNCLNANDENLCNVLQDEIIIKIAHFAFQNNNKR